MCQYRKVMPAGPDYCTLSEAVCLKEIHPGECDLYDRERAEALADNQDHDLHIV